MSTMWPVYRMSVVFVAALVFCHAANGTNRYVAVNNPTPLSPYTNWTDAAANIQDAIDVSVADDTVWVTNGVYDTGGNSSRRVNISKVGITVRSVNGPGVTIIDGLGTNRPVIMTSNSWLIGFTLTNGNAGASYGGGMYGASANSNSFVSNCVIVCNVATVSFGGGVRYATVYNSTISGNSGKNGGGAANSKLYNCVISNNLALEQGGGAYVQLMYNCLVVGNSSTNIAGGVKSVGGLANPALLVNCTIANNSATNTCGGTYWCLLSNSIVYHNTAAANSNNYESTFGYSCTAPLPAGAGNISADPQFVNKDAGDYRLTRNSPCVNAGTNQDWMTTATDLDGHQRIDRFSGRVDMGAYEFIFRGVMFTSY